MQEGNESISKPHKLDGQRGAVAHGHDFKPEARKEQRFRGGIKHHERAPTQRILREQIPERSMHSSRLKH
jgi:hypothetical protein